MTDKIETWQRFSIICRKCGRHEDEGIKISADVAFSVTITCPCGEEEEFI